MCYLRLNHSDVASPAHPLHFLVACLDLGYVFSVRSDSVTKELICYPPGVMTMEVVRVYEHTRTKVRKYSGPLPELIVSKVDMLLDAKLSRYRECN
jgi:hypothetical protein